MLAAHPGDEGWRDFPNERRMASFKTAKPSAESRILALEQKYTRLTDQVQFCEDKVTEFQLEKNAREQKAKEPAESSESEDDGEDDGEDGGSDVAAAAEVKKVKTMKKATKEEAPKLTRPKKVKVVDYMFLKYMDNDAEKGVVMTQTTFRGYGPADDRLPTYERKACTRLPDGTSRKVASSVAKAQRRVLLDKIFTPYAEYGPEVHQQHMFDVQNAVLKELTKPDANHRKFLLLVGRGGAWGVR